MSPFLPLGNFYVQLDKISHRKQRRPTPFAWRKARRKDSSEEGILKVKPLVVYTQNAAGLGVQISEWVFLDAWCPGPVSVQVAIYNAPGAPVQYTVQQTLDDPNSPDSPVELPFVTWFNIGDANMVNSTVPAQSYYLAAPRYVRLVQTGGTGIAQLTLIQSGSICS